MTNLYQQASTIALTPPILWPVTPSAYDLTDLSKVKEDEVKNNIIIIDDIKEIETIVSKDYSKESSLKLLYTIGITPAPAISENLIQKIFISVLLSSILSIWISNELLLSMFIVLNIIDFLTSLFWERYILYKIHLSQMIGNFLLVGMATFAELLIGKHQILFFPITISIVGIALFFMNISLIWLITKRIFPFIALTRAGRVSVILKGVKIGYDACINYVEDEFSRSLTANKKNRTNN